MRTVQQHIAAWESKAIQHRFFHALTPDPSLPHALRFAPSLAFWVLAYQDILRLNWERTRDPDLRELLGRHRADDEHHRWFLADLARISGDARRQPEWLFEGDVRRTRDATYAIAAEVFRATDDRHRLVFVEAIESGARVFFERIAEYVDASGHTASLGYFSRHHFDVESHHEIVEAEMANRLRTTILPPDLLAEGLAIVDRVYGALLVMADGLADALESEDRAA